LKERPAVTGSEKVDKGRKAEEDDEAEQSKHENVDLNSDGLGQHFSFVVVSTPTSTSATTSTVGGRFDRRLLRGIC
jgi:hypothetical protein